MRIFLMVLVGGMMTRCRWAKSMPPGREKSDQMSKANESVETRAQIALMKKSVAKHGLYRGMESLRPVLYTECSIEPMNLLIRPIHVSNIPTKDCPASEQATTLIIGTISQRKDPNPYSH